MSVTLLVCDESRLINCKLEIDRSIYVSLISDFKIHRILLDIANVLSFFKDSFH